MSTRRYAERTTTSVAASTAEIESLIERFGAARFSRSWDDTHDSISFTYEGRPVRITVARPDRGEFGSPQMCERERMRQWRVMVMTVKALLVAVEEKVINFEDAFLSYFVMPSGATLGEVLVPRLDQAVREGASLLKLPPASAR